MNDTETTASRWYDTAAHSRPEIETRRYRVFRDPLGPTAYLFLRVLFQRTKEHTQRWLFQDDPLPRAILAVMAHCAYGASSAAHGNSAMYRQTYEMTDDLIACALGLATKTWQSPALNYANLCERDTDAWGTLTSLNGIIGMMAGAVARMGVAGVLRFDRSDALRNAAASIDEIASAMQPNTIAGPPPALPI